MSSLRRRLHRVLAILLGGLFLQWLVADRAIVYVVESEMESRLRHDADTLLATVELGDGGQPRCDPRSPGTVYSTEYSGHYYVLTANGRRVHSASFGRETPFVPRSVTGDVLDHISGPLGQPLLVLTLQSTIEGQPVLLSVGEDLSPMRTDLAHFRLVFLLLSLAVLGVAMALQERELRWALRPLEHLRAAVLEMREQGKPIGLADAPAEVRPLVNEVNRLLSFVARRLQQSRTAIGNLSHAVKTPLTAVFRLLEDSRLDAQPDLRAQLQEQAEAIRMRIDRELKRARLAGDAPAAAAFDARAELPALVKLLQQIHAGRNPVIEWAAPEEPLPLDRQDTLELIGNLADNACKWAQKRIQIEIVRREGIDIIVSDDGPGCTPEQITALAARGQRVDESTQGYGLGLAIARDIVEFAGGRLTFARSASLGGLQVAAHFPSRQRLRLTGEE